MSKDELIKLTDIKGRVRHVFIELILQELQENYHEVKITSITYGPNVPQSYRGTAKLYMPNIRKSSNGEERQGVAVFFDEANHIQEVVMAEKKSKEEDK